MIISIAADKHSHTKCTFLIALSPFSLFARRRMDLDDDIAENEVMELTREGIAEAVDAITFIPRPARIALVTVLTKAASKAFYVLDNFVRIFGPVRTSTACSTRGLTCAAA